MADIYTSEWYDAVQTAINAKVTELKEVPAGSWLVAVDIEADGTSPYVEPGTERHFLIQIVDGKCEWYREGEADESQRLNFRFRGPATAFDEIAAGMLDPIDAALRGTIRVKGDMRFLMRQAEHVKALLEAYSTVETAWPKGRPPYVTDREAVDA